MIFIALLLLTASIPSDDDCQLVSKSAQFDGTNLLFSDSVEIQNDLGTVIATKASFGEEAKGKNILLEQGVKFLFKNGGEIKSDNAEINLNTKKIRLFSQNKIFFQESLQGEKISITSSSAECGFNSSLKKSSLSTINSIAFDGGVEMHYKSSSLKGDRAEYQKSFSEPEVYLTSKERCFFKHNRDEIFAGSIKFYPAREEIFLVDPLGSIHFASYTFDINAKEGFYKKRGEEFILQKEVFIKDINWGSLQTDKILFTKEDKKLVAEGKTFLCLSGKNGKMSCKGTITLDDEKKEITANSCSDPIFFQDDKVIILSDQALLSYNQERAASKINLKGNIRFVSKHLDGKNGYGIADEVEYFPINGELYFTGNEGKRVLFWQEDDALAISANKVYVKKDPLSKKEEVKGIGDVRFSLDFEEEKMIKDLFSKYLDKI